MLFSERKGLHTKTRPLLNARRRVIIFPVDKQGLRGRHPPQRRTEAEVIAMTNVELFNSLLTVIGIILSAMALGIALKQR